MTKDILFIGYDNAQTMDIVGPWEVFAAANLAVRSDYYRLRLVTMDGRGVKTSSGLTLPADQISDVVLGDIDTFIVSGGTGALRASKDTALLNHLRILSASARRAASVCTGSFLLAAAGLLDGRRATTHWQSCDLLAGHFPGVDVDSMSIYVCDGKFWTSAGVTTGIDMSLAMVEEDLGADTAIKIAKGLVVYHHRPGFQNQFSTLLEAQSKARGPFKELINWIGQNLGQPLRVEDLAEKSGMGLRSFQRKFQAATGKTPARFVERLRLDASRRLLEESALSIKEIAGLSGFKGSVGYIQAFERNMGLSPSAYRSIHKRDKG